jgi:hypothetical protein
MWRLNQLNYKATRFRRAVIKPRDVLYPFGIMMSANIVILISWTVLNPPQWTRVDLANYYDEFGQPSASVATCRGHEEKAGGGTKVFFCLYFAINLLALIFANYQSYIARNYPSAYNEGYYIAISVGFLMEACLVGVPVLVLVQGSPTSDFLVRAILITVVCLVILLPLFVPKYLARNEKEMVEATRAIPNHSSRRDLEPLEPQMGVNRTSSFRSPEFRGSRAKGESSISMIRRRSHDSMPDFPGESMAEIGVIMEEIPSEHASSRQVPIFRRLWDQRSKSFSSDHSSEEFGS